MTLTVYMGPLGSTQEVQGSTGGGGDLFAHLGRADCSVNSACVENAWSDKPVLKTQTAGNVAGGFNGGGIGCKAILGVVAGVDLPLASLLSLSYTWRPLVPFNPTPFKPYANLIVELGAPAPAGYKILVIDPSTVPALNTHTTVANGDGTFTTSWDAGANLIQVVNDTPAYPPGTPPPVVDLGGTWLNRSYSLAQIAADYPLAALRQVSSLDGGLPKTTVTPPFLIVGGDSSNNRMQAWQLSAITFNGAPV